MVHDVRIRTADADLFRLTRARKVTLTAVLILTFIDAILTITTLIRPVPIFSTSGVLLIVELYDGGTSTGTSPTTTTVDNRKRWHTSDLFPTPSVGVASTFTAEGIPRLVGLAFRSNDTEFSKRSYGCDTCDETTKSKHGKATETPILHSSSRVPKATKKVTSTVHATATELGHLVFATPSVGGPGTDEDGTRVFAMWIGAQGICLKHRARALNCTSPSFSTQYSESYQQGGLTKEVQAVLPSSAGSNPMGMLIAAVFFIIGILAFAASLSPVRVIWIDNQNNHRALDTAHQVFMTLGGVLLIVALVTLLTSTLALRLNFSKAANAVRGLDSTLQASLGSGFSQLYIVMILTGIQILFLVVFITEDLRFPWWAPALASKSRIAFSGGISGLNFTSAGGATAA